MKDSEINFYKDIIVKIIDKFTLKGFIIIFAIVSGWGGSAGGIFNNFTMNQELEQVHKAAKIYERLYSDAKSKISNSKPAVEYDIRDDIYKLLMYRERKGSEEDR